MCPLSRGAREDNFMDYALLGLGARSRKVYRILGGEKC